MENSSQEHAAKKHWYDKWYKPMLFIPILFTLIALVYIWHFQSVNGDIIRKDVTLTGGTSVTVIDSKTSLDNVRTALLPKFPDIVVREISEFRTGEQKGFIVESKAKADELRPALESFLGYKLTEDNSSTEFSGAATSQGFYKQLRFSILLTFLLMGVIVFITFRTVVPSTAVMLAAFSDIVLTLAIVNYLGMTLSLAGVMSFLLLIGYSIDSDVVLTTQVLKNKQGTINNRVYKAFKTGVTMTLTSITAVLVSLIVIYSFSEVMRQIFTILLIGLTTDLFTTWFSNASMIKWYEEKREAKK